MMGDYLDPSVYLTDQVNYTLVDLPDTDPRPSPRLHRAASATAVRAATTQEQADYDQIALDAAVRQSVDAERLISAVIWAIIDTYSAPATVAKYQAARTKIINAYKARPWNP
jgi:hypothetical protein